MLVAPDALWVLLGALVLDAIVGDPDVIWRRWPHPAAWFGALVAAADRRFNQPERSERTRRVAGALAILGLTLVAAVVGLAVETGARRLPGGTMLVAVPASVLLAGRSLHDHVRRVRLAFAEGIGAARRAVSMIVGRDPESLDEPAIARAAIESTAENFSDGLVAPAFWFAIGGLGGLCAYKMINTADSMIGHMSDRHRAFGWASARIDDVVNLAPARLSGCLVALAAPSAGGSVGTALQIMARDAGLHRSPNAGWPESAMAGALGLALGGPRRYASGPVAEPFLHAEGRRDVGPADIDRALRVMITASVLHAALYGVLALLLAHLT